jgi:hypothetical protein
MKEYSMYESDHMEQSFYHPSLGYFISFFYVIQTEVGTFKKVGTYSGSSKNLNIGLKNYFRDLIKSNILNDGL